MHCLGSVQQRMKCIFNREVIQQPSSKRGGQSFQVIATSHVSPEALESDIDGALATEKLDGTCCYVTEYKGQPYLWARLDIRSENVPETWIPARGDKHGSGPPPPPADKQRGLGWVPVDKGNKYYPMHSCVVNYDAGAAAVLRPSAESEELLEIALVPLADLQGQTLELIGDKVQGNPYHLGKSVRLLVAHGTVPLRKPPPRDFQQLHSWFTESPEGRAEGIVWHCEDGTMFKLHRPHMGLRWPLGDTSLGSRPVVVNVSGELLPRQQQAGKASEDVLTALSKLNGQRFSRLQDVKLTLEDRKEEGKKKRKAGFIKWIPQTQNK